MIKNFLFFLFFIMFPRFLSFAQSQDTLYLHHNTGAIFKFAVGEVDSIKFLSSAQSQDTLCLHHKTGTIFKYSVVDVDSIIFFAVIPKLITTKISSISGTSATSGGTITSDGGASVTVRGVVWSTSQNPTVALDTKTSNGTGKGTFSSAITGLIPNTTYYIRAYATNSVSTVYGNQLSFTTRYPANIDGYTYPIVTIGSQTWMAENLRTTKYSDGTSIPLVTNTTTPTTPAMFWYNNDQRFYKANKYGALYNWYAVSPTTNGGKNICPTGWHLPSDDEWTILTTYLGGESVAGGKLKTTGTTKWMSPNAGATSTSGFLGVPGGGRSYDGNFSSSGYFGYWWTTSENNTDTAWLRYLNYNNDDVYRFDFYKETGFSVRCIRD